MMYIAIGLCFGVVIGTALDHLALGIAIGVAIGTVIDRLWNSKRKADETDEEQ